jgi:MoxR-like ATPase
VAPVVSTLEIRALREAAERVFVDPLLVQHAVRLAAATRKPAAYGLSDRARHVLYGASPRASIYLIVAGRALAFVRGRTYVLPQDIADVTHDVMRHRIILSYEALSEGVTADDVIAAVEKAIPAPAQVRESHAAAAT